MKKYILISSLACASLLAACSKEASKTATPPASAPAAAAAPAATGNSAVNDYVKAYSAYADEYIAALAAAKKGDTTKMQSLTARAQELSAKQAEIAGKLTPADAQAFSDAMTKIAQRMQEAATK